MNRRFQTILSRVSKRTLSNNIVPVKQGTTIQQIKHNPWQEVKDPNGGPLSYWWNPETNQTTPLGAPRPAIWIEQKDPSGNTDLTYWWNPESGETTPLGAEYPIVPIHSQQITPGPTPFHRQPQTSVGGGMMQMVMLGFGFAAAFGVVRIFLG